MLLMMVMLSERVRLSSVMLRSVMVLCAVLFLAGQVAALGVAAGFAEGVVVVAALALPVALVLPRSVVSALVQVRVLELAAVVLAPGATETDARVKSPAPPHKWLRAQMHSALGAYSQPFAWKTEVEDRAASSLDRAVVLMYVMLHAVVLLEPVWLGSVALLMGVGRGVGKGVGRGVGRVIGVLGVDVGQGVG